MSHEPLTDAELAELERVYAAIPCDGLRPLGEETVLRLLATIRDVREECESKYGLCE